MKHQKVLELNLVPTATSRVPLTELATGCCSCTAAPVPHHATR